MSYYDIDDILADGEKVPCQFNLKVPGLGYLEGNPGKAVEEGTKLELPLWLASTLATCGLLENSDQSFVDLLEPDFISAKVLNAIRADPRSVDLHSFMGNYYAVVQKWVALFGDTQLAQTVINMFKERALEIDNYASNSNKLVNSTFLLSLDEWEKKLFRETSDSKKDMKLWSNYA